MAEPIAPRSRLLLGSPRLWIGLAGMAATLVAMILNSTRHTTAGEEIHFSAWTLFEGALLLVALGVAPLRRVDAHLFVRAVLWGLFAFFGIAATDGDTVAPLVAFLGAGAALLSLGGLGLDAEGDVFAPRVLRRSLVTMMVVGLCVAHLEGLLAYALIGEVIRGAEWMEPAELAARAAHAFVAALAPVWLVVAVAGVSRMRGWGLLAYVGSLLWSGLFALLVHFTAQSFLSVLFGFFAAATTLGGLPVLSALVFKRRPSAQGRRVGEWVHGVLVVAAIATALYVRHVDPGWLDRFLD